MPARTTAPHASRPDGPSWRAAVAGPVVAVAALAIALAFTDRAGVPLRDPGSVTITRVAIALALLAVLVAIDAGIRRRRWTAARLAAVAGAVGAFYATYFAYRNLKSIVPLLRPDELFDRRLASLDRTLFFGHDPGDVLHSALGTGAAAHALSAVYMGFFLFIPVTVAFALAFSRRLDAGLFYVAALGLNWVLAAGCYFLLPSIGPFHALAGDFADLPVTGASRLQDKLVAERGAFLGDPGAPGAAQSIGAFASLHVSVYVTAALACHVLGLRRAVKAGAWTLTALTVLATIYFGWHYLLDDVAGAAIAVTALGLARVLTAFDVRAARPARAVPAAVAEPA